MLLGLARGSGARSLAGMPPCAAAAAAPPARPAAGHDASPPARRTASTPWDDPHNATTRLTPGSGRRARCSPTLERDARGRAWPRRWPARPTCCASDADALDEPGRRRPCATCRRGPERRRLDVDALAAAAAGDPHPRAAALAADGRRTARRRQRGARRGARRLVTAWHGQGPLHVPGGIAVGRTGGAASSPSRRDAGLQLRGAAHASDR